MHMNKPTSICAQVCRRACKRMLTKRKCSFLQQGPIQTEKGDCIIRSLPLLYQKGKAVL
jgi:hypothetical protein